MRARMGGRSAAIVVLAVVLGVPAFAVELGAQRAAGRPGGRAALPPVGPNMNQQQVQTWLDTYALVQAERELQLTPEQYPGFVARLTRLQNVRRRQAVERRRLLNELGPLVQGGPSGDEAAIEQRLQSLETLGTRSAAELRNAYREIDALLTPWQRGRFRLFEEQLERRKIELLARVGGRQGG